MQHINQMRLGWFTEEETRIQQGAEHSRVEEGIDAYWEQLNSPAFVVFHELMEMANDAQQAERHLSTMPSADVLKDDMVRTIVSDQTIPTKLQYALSQRLYYEELQKGLFWARNDPEVRWLGNEGEARRN